ncbi:NAD(P)H-binding protein [Streptomyces griseus]|uniref:NAD(P)H-binding protein n=1 Tax=Streptomyces griseus TaxID=1911 RepID=UPI00055E51FA|nr:NAD(P)H-binding protein [Streptomyces griseus]
MTFLVTGATGHVGRHVVDGLIEAGATVRALTRDPAAAHLPDGVEVREGDLTRAETWAAALKGIERLYLFPVPETAAEFVDAAKQAGVQRIVVLSSDAVTDGTDSGHHTVVERAVEMSGLHYSHVRPGEFALNKLDVWAPSIAAEGVVRAPYASSRGLPVHEIDVAAVAVAALREDGLAGAALRVTGPQALTVREQVSAIAEGIGQDIAFEELTPEEAREGMVEQGCPPPVADYILAFQARWVDEPPVAATTVPDLIGRPALSLARWAADHVADFR